MKTNNTTNPAEVREIDLSSCGRAILLSMVKDLRKRVAELQSLEDEKIVPEDVRDAIIHLFLRIGSWTNARWEQHLRNEYGDEKTDRIIKWLIDEGILHHFPKDSSAGFAEEDLVK